MPDPAAPELAYPNLVPAPGWTGYRAGTQQRYLPPGTDPRTARVAIIVSPLVPRTPRLPPPAELIAEALAAEEKASGVTVIERIGPRPVRADAGLPGVSLIARVRGATGVERRIYVMYEDPGCYYGISYLAAEDAYAAHEAEFWKMAGTIRAVTAPPDGAPFTHYGE